MWRLQIQNIPVLFPHKIEGVREAPGDGQMVGEGENDAAFLVCTCSNSSVAASSVRAIEAFLSPFVVFRQTLFFIQALVLYSLTDENFCSEEWIHSDWFL